jgi:hypothetical protein
VVVVRGCSKWVVDGAVAVGWSWSLGVEILTGLESDQNKQNGKENRQIILYTDFVGRMI